ncbi:30S ribosomal protein S4 [Candidatus Fermentibacteria bacterium]|nr:30S ribosomal protein S4 [Candidatus Fermentibacteria bacterium]
MARNTGPSCKLCRREGTKLFLKGRRCLSDRCAIERRPYPPGERNQKHRPRTSEYGTQLREKQKMKRIYGVLEQQFHGAFMKAARQKGVTGENLLRVLERRLDNVVYRLGFAPSRAAARQLIRHRHIHVNGRRVTIPSFLVSPGHVVSVIESSRANPFVQQSVQSMDRTNLAQYLSLDEHGFSGKLVALPARVDIPTPVIEQLIVELYSK